MRSTLPVLPYSSAYPLFFCREDKYRLEIESELKNGDLSWFANIDNRYTKI